MEEDAKDLKSRFLKRPSVQKQFKLIKAAAEEASDINEVEAAKDPAILYALEIVRNFIEKKKRVCYGGTAINALLPKSLKFYDPDKDLPDYDFFTPNPDKDIDDIVKDLKKEGFTDVLERVGMHDGTYKILVNYVPIADMTRLDPGLYNKIYERSIKKEGIHYADVDLLRMLMYLELSRPRGEVTRWEKVFERLTLLNAAFPFKTCDATTEELVERKVVPLILRKQLLDYVIENKRVIIGADVISMYDWLITKTRAKAPSIQWFLKRNGMMVFLSPEPVQDAIKLREIFASSDISLETLRGVQELVPERVVLKYKGVAFLMVVKEIACHGYNTLVMKDDKKLLVGSLETMITFYFALTFFTEDGRILNFLMFCLTQKLLEMSEILHEKGGKGPIPAFSIECSGYQKGYATLLKEKIERIAKEKKKKLRNTSIKKTKKYARKTRKNHSS